MYQTLPQRGAVVLAAFLALPVSPARAQEPSEVEGVITNVELVHTPRTITVERPGGGKVVARIANRTRVLFRRDEGDVGDLKPGMSVRFRAQHGVVERVHVVSGSGFVHAPAAREVKARILEIDHGRGRLTLDVAGHRETYGVRDSRLLRAFGVSDLVIITLDENRGDSVRDIRSAAVSGRVTRLDLSRGTIKVEVDGRDLYEIEDPRVVEDVREGDRIRFEFEDRSAGRKVITRLMP